MIWVVSMIWVDRFAYIYVMPISAVDWFPYIYAMAVCLSCLGFEVILNFLHLFSF